MILEFDPHATDQMRIRQIPEEAVYHVVGDYERRIDRDDGVTEYFGTWEGREILVVLRWRDDEELEGFVITTVEHNSRSRRRR